MTGDVDATNGGDNKEKAIVGTKASPLELHLVSTVDENKGCYLGQESISAILKNKRGPPRYLYSIVFKDSMNDDADDQITPGDDDMSELLNLLGASSSESGIVSNSDTLPRS